MLNSKSQSKFLLLDKTNCFDEKQKHNHFLRVTHILHHTGFGFPNRSSHMKNQFKWMKSLIRAFRFDEKIYEQRFYFILPISKIENE